MDAVMKILKEIERQSAASREVGQSPQQQQKPSRKQRRAAAEAAQQQSMQEANQDSARADDWEPAKQVATTRQQWDRQRVVDALQMMMILGPPPGLED
ncbi:hypothetical protein JST97_16565 [bacterium]|nr:hypothetical protein [bacterium]